MHIWYRTTGKIYSDASKNICCVQELQLNILQQTHLMQAGEKVKSSVLLQQLQTKQQQLMGQLQQAQHLLTLNMLIQVTTRFHEVFTLFGEVNVKTFRKFYFDIFSDRF